MDAQRGRAANQVLAPEEPNVYRHRFKRSTSAPAERNVSGGELPGRIVSLPWSEEGLFELPRSINISSLRDEEGGSQNLGQKTRS